MAEGFARPKRSRSHPSVTPSLWPETVWTSVETRSRVNARPCRGRLENLILRLQTSMVHPDIEPDAPGMWVPQPRMIPLTLFGPCMCTGCKWIDPLKGRLRPDIADPDRLKRIARSSSPTHMCARSEAIGRGLVGKLRPLAMLSALTSASEGDGLK